MLTTHPTMTDIDVQNELERERKAHRKTQQRLDWLLEFAPEAIVLLDVETGRFLNANLRAQELFGLSRETLAERGPFDLSPPEQPDGTSRERGTQRIQEAVNGGCPVFEWWHLDAQGRQFPCEVRLVKMPWVDRDVIRGTIIDITDRKRLELCERGRSELLEKVARGLSFDRALAELVQIIEELLPKMRCSILLLENDRLRLGAAPHLPDFYNAAVDNLKIGPHVGCCGAAAATGKRCIVADVMQHENWAPFRDLAEQADFRACWSEPIRSLEGEVLGTFASYYREPREPIAVELEVIEFAAQLAGTVMEHHRMQKLLQAANEQLQARVDQRTAELQRSNQELMAANENLHLASVAFETCDSIIITDLAGRILRVNDSFTRLTGYSADEVVGQTPRILKSGVHDEPFYRRMWDTIRTEGYWEGEIWNRKKNGEVFPQRLSITAVTNAQGKITHYVGDGQDITVHKRAAAARTAMEVARHVQQRLFPESMPSLHGFDVAGAALSAEHVSGDYFDFIPLVSGNLIAAVADVCGHGLGPALLSAQLNAYVRALSETDTDPGAILTRVNRLFYNGGATSFATTFLAHVDAANRSLIYAGAGHRGYLLRPGAGAVFLNSTGLPVGVVADTLVHSSPPMELQQADILVFATDGIEETRNPAGEIFGKERMFETVNQHVSEPAMRIIQAVFQTAREFAAGELQQDDMTLVLVKVL